MRKLIGAVTAVLVLAILASGCGGSSEQSAHEEVTPGFHISLQQPSVPHPVNNEMFYMLPVSYRSSAIESVYVFDGHGWVKSATTASFIAENKGVRIQTDPHTQVIESRLIYLKVYDSLSADRSEVRRFVKWSGESPAPWTKTITVNGKQHRLKLREISVWLYDPHLPHSVYLGA
jgi:hypothetical protein